MKYKCINMGFLCKSGPGILFPQRLVRGPKSALYISLILCFSHIQKGQQRDKKQFRFIMFLAPYDRK